MVDLVLGSIPSDARGLRGGGVSASPRRAARCAVAIWTTPMADDELPIDVHYDKLIDWLVDRKKVSKDWRKKLASVHAKLSERTRELPGVLTRASGFGVPDVVLADSNGEPARWDYFRAALVRDKIVTGAELNETADDDDDVANASVPGSRDSKETSATSATRGLFGRLTGSAKLWDDIVKSYEKETLHVPEAGSTMVRLVRYDFPRHETERAKYQKQASDSERKATEHRKNARVAKETFETTCVELGVDPVEDQDFVSAVDGLVLGLEPVFESVFESARTEAIGEALDHYARWTAWAHGTDATGSVTGASLLPNLTRLRDVSETDIPDEDVSKRETVASPAAGKTEPEARFPDTENDARRTSPSFGGIDWDIGGFGGNAPVEVPHASIDWDLSGPVEAPGDPAAETSPAEMDRGDGAPAADPEREDLGESHGCAAIEIDWDVRDVMDVAVEDITVVAGRASIDSVSETIDGAGAISISPDAVRKSKSERPKKSASWYLLSDRDFRTRAVDDLLELSAFLTQRASDAGNPETNALMASAPVALRKMASDVESLRRLSAACEAPVSALGEDSARRLLLVAGSPKFRRRLSTDLRAMAQQSEKLTRLAEECDARRAECQRWLKVIGLRLERDKKTLREVKAFVEGEVSKMYKGRTVRVVGEVHTILQGCPR